VTIQDQALAGMVANALNQDKRLAGQAIAVRVANGDVFLKGIVDDEDSRQLAQIVASGIPGVRQVNLDELRLREVAK
jgi:osmotically-inducible protein OsmY